MGAQAAQEHYALHRVSFVLAEAVVALDFEGCSTNFVLVVLAVLGYLVSCLANFVEITLTAKVN